MAIFAIHIDENAPEAEEAVSALMGHFSEHDRYPISDTLYLVKGEMLTKDVGEIMGARPGAESQPRCAIFRLNGSYWGFYDRGLWEWMEEA